MKGKHTVVNGISHSLELGGYVDFTYFVLLVIVTSYACIDFVICNVIILN